MHLALRQQSVFKPVARHTRYSRAAEALHLGQPAESMQTRQLEEAAGLPLFEKPGKKIHLTEAGRECFHYRQAIGLALREADEVIEALKGARTGRLALVLAGLLAAWSAVAEPVDGRWQLQISGHNSYLFGEPGFGGGVRIPWEVVIQFEVQAAQYQLGSGTARWLDETTALSRPPGWFSCRPVEGTYLDSNLVLHQTPRVRFAGFPVAGEVRKHRVQLEPGYQPPGNYLAVTYECTTDNPLAYNWFPLAERGKQILGKRQDAEKQSAGDS